MVIIIFFLPNLHVRHTLVIFFFNMCLLCIFNRRTRAVIHMWRPYFFGRQNISSGVYLLLVLSFQSKARNNNVTPPHPSDLHFYKIHEYHEGGQGEIFLQWSMSWNSIFMIIIWNCLGIWGRQKHFFQLKTDDLSDAPNANKKPSASYLHTSCDLNYNRTK